MKYLFLLISSFSILTSAFAQETEEFAQEYTYEPDLRAEVVLNKTSSEKYFVLPTGEDGLVLFNMLDSIGDNRKERIWAFTKFTTEFVRIWSREIAVPYRLIYDKHYWDGVSLHVLLLHEKRNKSDSSKSSASMQKRGLYVAMEELFPIT